MNSHTTLSAPSIVSGERSGGPKTLGLGVALAVSMTLCGSLEANQASPDYLSLVNEIESHSVHPTAKKIPTTPPPISQNAWWLGGALASLFLLRTNRTKRM